MHGAAFAALAVSACAPTTTAAPSDALGDLDATGVAARIRSGEITAAEAVDAAIARIERLNPQLNFMASSGFDAARARAATALSGPFAGVPTLIKDLAALAGQPLEFGCRGFKGNVAQQQSPYVDALIAAGLAPLGKSATPEFGLTATTESALMGPTRNPWNVQLSSGGSSGGAAAAVASGAVPFAHGSDGGGSIRIPASCCGLFGLKVSRGRNLATGAGDNGASLSVSGCLSRSVRDNAAWLAAGENRADGAAFPAVGMVSGPSAQRLRIGVAIPDLYGREPHPHVKAAIEGVAELCTSLGHNVSQLSLSNFEGQTFSDAFITMWAALAAEAAGQAKQINPGKAETDILEPLTIGLAEMHRAAPRNALARAIATMREADRQYAALFADIDVMLTPVLAAPPPQIGLIAPSTGMAGFAKVRDYVSYTPLQNAVGAPAMSVPLSMSPDGLPIGAHFSAAKGQEKRLLELAYELEQAAPWAGRRPAVWAG